MNIINFLNKHILFFFLILLLLSHSVVSPLNSAISTGPVPPSQIAADSTDKKQDAVEEPLSFQEHNHKSYGLELEAIEEAKTIKDKPLKVEAYFSPTCSHCAHFFKTTPSLLLPHIKANHLKLWVRPFCSYEADFIICQLSLHAGGEEQFLYYLTSFFRHFEEWVKYLHPDHQTPQKKEVIIQKMLEKYQSIMPANYNELLNPALKIGPQNPYASIIIIALALGVSPQKINEALEGPAKEKMRNQLMITALQALDAKGESVGALPVFYINSKFYGALTAEGLKKMLDSGEVTPSSEADQHQTTPIRAQ